MKAFSILLCTILLAGCDCQQTPQRRTRVIETSQPQLLGGAVLTNDGNGAQNGLPQVLYDGYVRSIDWQGRSFVYESGWGYVKTIGPVCGREMMPVWQGMHVYEINLHWYQPPDWSGCFQIDYIGHRAGVPGE